MPSLLLVSLTTNFWLFTEVSVPSLKRSMILRICRDSRNRQGRVSFATYCGQTQSMTIAGRAPKSLSRTMSAGVHISSDNKQRTLSYKRTSCCRFSGHMKHSSMGIKCINGTELKSSQLLSQYSQPLTIVMYIITRARSSNLSRTRLTFSSLTILLTHISCLTLWMCSPGQFHLWQRRLSKCC